MLLLLIGLVWIYFSFSKRMSDAEQTINKQSDAIARLITGGVQAPPATSKKKVDLPKRVQVEEALEENEPEYEVNREDQMTEKTFKED